MWRSLDFCLPIQLFNIPTIKQARLAWGNVENPRKDTLNSAYNEVVFNEKPAITKENLCTKYTRFTYKYIALNEKLPITKQNLCIFFFITGGVECKAFLLIEPSLTAGVRGSLAMWAHLHQVCLVSLVEVAVL